MGRLVIKRLKAIVSCDANDTVYENADMLIEDNKIAYIGDMTDGIRRMGASMIDGRNMICYPGLINTHHHFYQYFSRNLPQVQNMELFDWLKTLYEIWKGIDREIVYCSSALAMTELMKWGCTTAFDHHYVFPKAAGHLLIDEQFRAADDLAAVVGSVYHFAAVQNYANVAYFGKVVVIEEYKVAALQIAHLGYLCPVVNAGIACRVQPSSVAARLFKTIVYQTGAIEFVRPLRAEHVFVPKLLLRNGYHLVYIRLGARALGLAGAFLGIVAVKQLKCLFAAHAVRT